MGQLALSFTRHAPGRREVATSVVSCQAGDRSPRTESGTKWGEATRQALRHRGRTNIGTGTYD